MFFHCLQENVLIFWLWFVLIETHAYTHTQSMTIVKWSWLCVRMLSKVQHSGPHNINSWLVISFDRYLVDDTFFLSSQRFFFKKKGLSAWNDNFFTSLDLFLWHWSVPEDQTHKELVWTTTTNITGYQIFLSLYITLNR